MRDSSAAAYGNRKLLIISLVITLWSWFSRKPTKSNNIINDSLESYKICVNNNIPEKQCLDYFKIHTLERASTNFSKEDFAKICACYEQQQEDMSLTQVENIDQNIHDFKDCFNSQLMTPEIRSNFTWQYPVVMGLAVLGWGVFKTKAWKSEYEGENDGLGSFAVDVKQMIDDVKIKQTIMTELLNRTNQKIFELEYDSEVWEKIQELEQIQTRLQLLLDQTKRESNFELSKINNNLRSLTAVERKEPKWPFVIEEKEKGLLFDMTTKKGLDQWKTYVSKSDVKEKLETTQLPQLTPLSYSPISPDLSKVNLFDKNGKPYRRVFLPGTGWVARDTCIQIMKDASSPNIDQNKNSITY
ncbi:unnamed protein product [Kluyveromyces dobzhanskii CBS 2104]|uniref:WGS project CCBQ000000000 data, contig 00041 n=1 Tax=Kluyveromyces dobzhanskii CBS 2104 TaxID=1427455 RepID=A0A0A8L2D8_9SACH|nr:unnamed protein product [Kluyveromyces dobzhanskii CBS 2104]